MTNFNIFYFIENIVSNNNNIKNKQNKNETSDNKIIILYDEEDGNFYYYGTRNRENKTKYIQYSGKFHYSRLNELIQFMDILFDGFSSKITTELHEILLHEDEYDMMNFEYLKAKISNTTELAAYDVKSESYDNIYNYLQTLITHEI